MLVVFYAYDRGPVGGYEGDEIESGEKVSEWKRENGGQDFIGAEKRRQLWGGVYPIVLVVYPTSHHNLYNTGVSVLQMHFKYHVLYSHQSAYIKFKNSFHPS